MTVYALHVLGTNLVKIGFTKKPDVDNRRADIQQVMPLPVVVLGVMVDAPLFIEWKYHHALTNLRIRGEWYVLDEEGRKKLLSLFAAEVFDPEMEARANKFTRLKSSNQMRYTYFSNETPQWLPADTPTIPPDSDLTRATVFNPARRYLDAPQPAPYIPRFDPAPEPEPEPEPAPEPEPPPPPPPPDGWSIAEEPGEAWKAYAAPPALSEEASKARVALVQVLGSVGLKPRAMVSLRLSDLRSACIVVKDSTKIVLLDEPVRKALDAWLTVRPQQGESLLLLSDKEATEIFNTRRRWKKFHRRKQS